MEIVISNALFLISLKIGIDEKKIKNLKFFFEDLKKVQFFLNKFYTLFHQFINSAFQSNNFQSTSIP